MTAFCDERNKERARNAGAACFLNKPFEDTGIIRCIEHALNGPGCSLAP